MKSTTQTYKDGLLKISSIGNTAGAGDYKVDGPVEKHTGIRYDRLTVGMNRYWQGKQLDVKIVQLLRCPLLKNVNPFDVVTTEDNQVYLIEQLQYPKGVEPPSMDLSLSVIKVDDDL